MMPSFLKSPEGSVMDDWSHITQGVINMLKINMGVQAGEKVLVTTDLPTPEEWTITRCSELHSAVARSFLAKAVSEIASTAFPDCHVAFFPYRSVGQSGAEPSPELAQKMKEHDVVVAITTYSLSHTDARVEACKAGTRVASMPRFEAEMFFPGAIMSADYEQIAVLTRVLAEKLTEAEYAVVRSQAGTHLAMSLVGRDGLSDTGILREKGAFGNLPAGEAYIAPLEGTGNGKLVVERDWFPGEEDMTLYFRDGLVEKVEGGGKLGEDLCHTLGFDQDTFLPRRNLAELGIGTNPYARFSTHRLEMEKIKDTVHVAIGDNAHIGGVIQADLHWDFILSGVTLLLDGQEVIRDGKLLDQTT
jgi:leucyl aminopeptidase (aminopeptidase T)